MRARVAVATLSVAVASTGVVAAAERPSAARSAPVATLASGPSPADDLATLRRVQARASRSAYRHRLRVARLRAARRARERAEERARARAALVRVRASADAVPDVWLALKACEAGVYGWTADTGNGFYGAYQLTAGNAAAYGFARPDTLAPADQLRLARLVLRDQGPGAWPVCGPRVGLERGD